MKLIRAKTVVIIEHELRYLFTVCHEETTGRTFYIPVGGGINFGEHSSDAACREVFEETGLEIENLVLIDISENVFTYNGVVEHEIVFAYKAEFINKESYLNTLKGNKNDRGEEIKLVWASLEEIKDSDISVYPFGLLKQLELALK